MTALLSELEPTEIIGFKEQFDQRQKEAFRWDLWAVAYIINGGCSDDGFVYFCCWLTGQGREYFEAALKNPERAADNARDGYYNECEALMYCALKAYETKTGLVEMPRVEKLSSDSVFSEPKGTPWIEDDLPQLFPVLCKKFGYD